MTCFFSSASSSQRPEKVVKASVQKPVLFAALDKCSSLFIESLGESHAPGTRGISSDVGEAVFARPRQH